MFHDILKDFSDILRWAVNQDYENFILKQVMESSICQYLPYKINVLFQGMVLLKKGDVIGWIMFPNLTKWKMILWFNGNLIIENNDLLLKVYLLTVAKEFFYVVLVLCHSSMNRLSFNARMLCNH